MDVSLSEGVMFVDTSDLPPPEAVIPTTPLKGQQQEDEASPASAPEDPVSTEADMAVVSNMQVHVCI